MTGFYAFWMSLVCRSQLCALVLKRTHIVITEQVRIKSFGVQKHILGCNKCVHGKTMLSLLKYLRCCGVISVSGGTAICFVLNSGFLSRPYARLVDVVIMDVLVCF